MVEKGVDIAPANGKLGILLVGLGAVSTTFVAGVEAIRKGTAQPVGSLTQMGTIRLGKRTDNNCPKIKDFVPLADLNDVVFGAWDIFSDSAYEAALHAGVLDQPLDARVQRRQRVRLLKERMRRLVRRGQEHDPPDMLRDSLHRGRRGSRRSGPDQEHSIDVAQAVIKSLGSGEVAAYDVGLGRQVGGVRVARQRAHIGANGQQLGDNLTADMAGGPGDEDAFHAPPSYLIC